jgi:hypothetical protein
MYSYPSYTYILYFFYVSKYTHVYGYLSLRFCQIFLSHIDKLLHQNFVVVLSKRILLHSSAQGHKIFHENPWKLKFMYPKLLTQRDVQLVKKALVIDADHSRECEKKRDGPSSFIITTYFWFTNPYKKHDEMFFKDFVFYIVRLHGIFHY